MLVVFIITDDLISKIVSIHIHIFRKDIFFFFYGRVEPVWCQVHCICMTYIDCLVFRPKFTVVTPSVSLVFY